MTSKIKPKNIAKPFFDSHPVKPEGYFHIFNSSSATHRKSSSIGGGWISQESCAKKSPCENQINQVFNSVKDINDKENLVEAIRKLKTVHGRLQLIDKLMKRKEEIEDVEELAQISKLGPIFEKVRQKFMKKINQKKLLDNVKTRSSLFRLNSILVPRKESDYGDQKESKKSCELSVEEVKKEERKRGTVLNILSGFNERKFLQQKSGEFHFDSPINEKFKGKPLTQRKFSMPKLEKTKEAEVPSHCIKGSGSLTQRKSSLGNISWSKQNVLKLEKELFKYELNIENGNRKILESSEFDPYLNKNVRSIDCEVRKLLSDFKTSKLKDLKTYFKRETGFRKKEPGIFGFQKLKCNAKSIERKTNGDVKIEKKLKNNQGDNDDSFVSYTEMRLDQLYKESQQLNKQIKVLDQLCFTEQNFGKLGYNQESRSRKMIDLEIKSRDILNTIKRKFQMD